MLQNLRRRLDRLEAHGSFVVLFYYDGETPPPIPTDAETVVVVCIETVTSPTAQMEDNGHASEH
jgi:hypothetical protein